MDARSNKWCCVINTQDIEKGKLITLKNMQNAFIYNQKCLYWYILHDKDIKEDGSFKTPHYHLCLWFNFKSCYKQYIIDYLSDLLNCSKNIISVEPMNNLVVSLRYLTHIDDEEKYQYSDEDVFTNSSIIYYRSILGQKINAQYLIECLKFVNFNKVKLIDTFITIDEYKRYRDVLDDLINEYREVYKNE